MGRLAVEPLDEVRRGSFVSDGTTPDGRSLGLARRPNTLSIQESPMSATGATRSTPDGLPDRAVSARPQDNSRRLATETKASFKTTEFFAFLAAVAGVLIAAGMVDEANNGGLGAKQAWLYVTILTVGYMVSRGLAKSGSREPYTEDRS
jgi:hypothetical protein